MTSIITSQLNSNPPSFPQSKLGGFLRASGGEEASAGGALDTVAKFVAKASQSQIGAGKETYQRAKWARLEMAAKLRPTSRTAQCMHRMVGGAASLIHHAEFGSASFSGLMTCGSPHACPICAPKIAARRSKDIGDGLNNWLGQGGRAALVTLTIRHHLGLKLGELAPMLKEAIRRLTRHRRWREMLKAIGYIGRITTFEGPYSPKTGWHPHLHVLILYRGRGRAIERIRELINSLWLQVVGEAGGSAATIGQDVRPIRSAEVGAYVAKLNSRWGVGAELSPSSAKVGESIHWLDLLGLATEGDERAAALYLEYVEAMAALSSIGRFSPGLRRKLGLGQERSDEELAGAQEEHGRAVVVMPWEVWAIVLRHRARADLLIAGATGKAEAVAAALVTIGADPALCLWPPGG